MNQLSQFLGLLVLAAMIGYIGWLAATMDRPKIKPPEPLPEAPDLSHLDEPWRKWNEWLDSVRDELSAYAAANAPPAWGEFPSHYRAPTWKPGEPEPATPAA